MLDLKQNKQDFLHYVKTYVKREGIDDLMKYIEGETDFFTAPASTRFHLSCKGGLCKHSLNVLYRLIKEYANEYGEMDDKTKESVIIVSLFHDLCKANYYKEDVRNVKEDGKWVQVPYYTVNEELSLGHGEKSVMLIMQHMKLTTEEIVAINSHMGFSDTRVRGGDWSIVNQWEKYPLALLLHVADLKASKLDEGQLV